jgi:hypothetical protein
VWWCETVKTGPVIRAARRHSGDIPAAARALGVLLTDHATALARAKAAVGSVASLGRQTTASVVKSIFLVIMLGGLFAMFFASAGVRSLTTATLEGHEKPRSYWSLAWLQTIERWPIAGAFTISRGSAAVRPQPPMRSLTHGSRQAPDGFPLEQIRRPRPPLGRFTRNVRD